MTDLLLVALAGFAASMVDGALGMGFGPTSASILLSSGMPPSAVSATVNLAKVASGLAAGASHWRFGNIDRRLVLKIGLPGCLGALLGVTVLANVDGNQLRPWLAVLLIGVGARIMYRFRKPIGPGAAAPLGGQTLGSGQRLPDAVTQGAGLAGLAGGVTNGLVGAWGPVVTPFLLHRGVSPRIAVGSVNTAEVAVASVAAGALLPILARGSLDVGVVIAMLVGGVAAAPLAAWLVRFLPPRGMGVAVAALMLLTNSRELAGFAQLGMSRWVVYLAVVAIALFTGCAPMLRRRLGPATFPPNGENRILVPLLSGEATHRGGRLEHGLVVGESLQADQLVTPAP